MTATRLDRALPLQECPARVEAGRWYFGAAQDERVTSTDSADLLTLESSPDTTTCVFIANVQRDRQGFDLCLVRDPDQTCTAGELLRRANP